MIDRTFYTRLGETLKVYAGCGNMLGVVPLTEAGYSLDQDFRQDSALREYLHQWGTRINSDSVMVLIGDPGKAAEQGFHYEMYVFEPSGRSDNGLAGGVSTMCGNGVRAVASYIEKKMPGITEVKVKTMSGIRTVKIENGLYVVDMGEFVYRAEDLSEYVNTSQVLPNDDGNYFNSPIPKEILSELSGFIDTATWSIGLNGDRENGNIDGEPHVVIEVPNDRFSDLTKLRKLAVLAGPIVTKNLDCFPKEINVNFISVIKNSDGSVEILNCTHERNLGDDPDHSVTPACGTGSTVAGGFVLEKFPELNSVLVYCTGGDLVISRGEGNDLFMKGPAEEVL